MTNQRLTIYNASAGSGKTFQIAKNFLAKIIQSNDYYYVSKLIGLTFTNEAARQMKNRILDRLVKASKGDFSGEMQLVIEESREIIEEQLGKKLSDEAYLSEIQQRIKKRLTEILHQYDDFNLMTIDKFFTRLVKTFAREMDIPYDANIILDYNEVIDNLIDEIISEVKPDDLLMKNLVDLALENAESEKAWDIKANLSKVVNIIFDDNFKQQVEYIKTKNEEDFVKLKRRLLKRKYAIRKQYLEFFKAGRNIVKGYENYLNVMTIIYKFGNISEHKKLEFNKTQTSYLTGEKDNYRYYIIKRISSLPEAEKAYIMNELNDEIHAFMSKVYDYYLENHQEYILVSGLLDEINSLLILNALTDKIELFKETTHSVFLNDFPHLIQKQIFKNADADTPYIYLRLGEKYIHYFLDEFQDTSELQWTNMLPLIKEALSKDFSRNISKENPGDAMIVGDAKQSIYRFRNGKPEIFIDLSNPDLNEDTGNPFANVTGKRVENLKYNWRSDGNIIDFNNKFFGLNKSFLHNERYHRVFDTVSQEVPKANEKRKDKGLVKISILDKISNDENEVPEKVIEIIKDVTSRGYAYEDICFLFGQHDASVPVAEALNDEGIPVISARSLLLKKSEKVSFLINMMKYISQKTTMNLFDALQFLFNYHFPDNRQKWMDIMDKKSIKSVFKSLNDYGFDVDIDKFLKLNLYDMVIYLIDKFKLNNDDEDNYLQSFLDDIHSFISENKTGIPGYLEHWKEEENKLNVKSADTKGAVRFMTVHVSKGLEFPVVIFLGTQNILASIDKQSLMWVETDPDKFEGFKTLPISLSVLEYLDEYQLDYINGIEEKKFDNYNKLYVAHTRAKNELHILTQKPSKGETKGIAFKQLYANFLKQSGKVNGGIEAGDTYIFGEETYKNNEKSDAKTKHFEADFKAKYWAEKDDSKLKIQTRSFEYWSENKKTAIKYGMQIHDILSKINTFKDWEHNKEKLLANIGGEEKNQVENTIKEVLNHPELAGYFSDNFTILNEQAILIPQQYQSFKLRRPDRILIKNNEATIIDYKTGEILEKHHRQIDEYAKLLEEIGYKIKAKILVYIQEKVEIKKI